MGILLLVGTLFLALGSKLYPLECRFVHLIPSHSIQVSNYANKSTGKHSCLDNSAEKAPAGLSSSVGPGTHDV